MTRRSRVAQGPIPFLVATGTTCVTYLHTSVTSSLPSYCRKPERMTIPTTTRRSFSVIGSVKTLPKLTSAIAPTFPDEEKVTRTEAVQKRRRLTGAGGPPADRSRAAAARGVESCPAGELPGGHEEHVQQRQSKHAAAVQGRVPQSQPELRGHIVLKFGPTAPTQKQTAPKKEQDWQYWRPDRTARLDGMTAGPRQAQMRRATAVVALDDCRRDVSLPALLPPRPHRSSQARAKQDRRGGEEQSTSHCGCRTGNTPESLCRHEIPSSAGAEDASFARSLASSVIPPPPSLSECPSLQPSGPGLAAPRQHP